MKDFFHTNIIKYCNRPFETAEEMNKVIISRWNKLVGPKDTVYHEGDMGFSDPGPIRGVLAALNGKIHLVQGNHDKRLLKNAKVTDRFESIQPYLELKIDKKKIVLCHYAFEVWNQCHRGSWHLYGHSHGMLDDLGKLRMDVGVDTHDCYPYHFEEIRSIMDGREPPVE